MVLELGFGFGKVKSQILNLLMQVFGSWPYNLGARTGFLQERVIVKSQERRLVFFSESVYTCMSILFSPREVNMFVVDVSRRWLQSECSVPWRLYSRSSTSCAASDIVSSLVLIMRLMMVVVWKNLK